jgi:hypothetical protein
VTTCTQALPSSFNNFLIFFLPRPGNPPSEGAHRRTMKKRTEQNDPTGQRESILIINKHIIALQNIT